MHISQHMYYMLAQIQVPGKLRAYVLPLLSETLTVTNKSTYAKAADLALFLSNKKHYTALYFKTHCNDFFLHLSEYIPKRKKIKCYILLF